MNILAIDQGTSSTKAMVIGNSGEVLSVAEREIHPRSGPGGAVEQDPLELLNSVKEAGSAALAACREPVGAVGLANQGETVLVWDQASGQPLTQALSWQDRRAVAITDRLAGDAQRITEMSGLPFDPYFSAPKMTWLREQRSKGGVVTTTDTWMMHHLTGLFVTDVTTASRSMILDLSTRQWSPEAVRIFALDGEALPTVVDCADEFSTTTMFGPELPVTGLAVDQQAALIGEGCLSSGEAKCTYGTGAFLLVNTGGMRPNSKSGLSASVAWQIGDSFAYCLDGQSYTAGAAINWLIAMGLLDGAEDLDDIATSVGDTGGVTVVPSLAGLGAPQWNPSAHGLIEGLGLDTRPAHLVRGVLEGLAAQVALVAICAQEDVGNALVSLKVDGGLTQSTFLMQTQADLLQIPVEVFHSPHATALGVAELARVGAGESSSIQRSMGAPDLIYVPRISVDEARSRLEQFERATQRVAALSDERKAL